MALSLKSVVGVALEATPGTLIVSPTVYVPTKSMVKAIKQREYVMDERGDRNEEHDVIDTIRHGEWDMKGAFYPDTCGYFLAGALGAPTSAQQGGTAAYKHTFNLADTPPSLSLYKSFDAAKYSCAYSVVEKMSFKLSGPDKFLEFDASGKSLWPAIYTGTFSPSFSTVRPFAGYAPTITLTGGATNDIDELEITFEQKIRLWNPANGSQDWIAAYFGGRKVSFGFTARFDNSTLFENYYRANNVNDTMTVDFKGQYIINSYTVALGAATAGTFTLSYNGQTTAGIAYNATSGAVQTALTGLSSVGTGNATVTGTAPNFTVTFTGSLAQTSLPLTGSGTGLTGGAFLITPVQYNNELNIVIPVTTYDSFEHDLSKENVLVKAKGRGLAFGAGAGNNLIQTFVINSLTNYTV